MKPADIRTKSDAELAETAGQLRKELYDLRALAVTEKVENVRRFRELRRDVARVLTEQRARQTASSDQAAQQPA